MEDITARVDKVIAKIQEIHRNYWENGVGKQDIMIFSHGAHLIQNWVIDHYCMLTTP